MYIDELQIGRIDEMISKIYRETFSLNALFSSGILQHNDLDSEKIIRKLIPLVEAGIKIDSIHIYKDKIFLNNPLLMEFLNGKLSINEVIYDILTFHLCNIYTYVRGLLPRRISFLTILREFLLNNKIDYKRYPKFNRINLSLYEDENYYFTSPFDLFITNELIGYSSHHCGPIIKVLTNFISKILGDLVKIKSDYRTLMYILLQIIVERSQKIPKNSIESHLRRILRKKDNKFITESTLKYLRELKNVWIFPRSKLEYITPMLLIKDYLEYPSDEKLVLLINESDAYINELLTIAVKIVDYLFNLEHGKLILLF